MRDLEKYRGIIPAFYACYDKTGQVSKEGVRALTGHLLGRGIKGLYVNGSSGECIYLSPRERMLILEEVAKEAKGKATLICHVACNNTKDSMELARHAGEVGVDAIAAIPPIYFHLPEDAIAKYWNDISQAAPDMDFIIYNIPQLAGVALTPSLFKKMRENPRVIGVKNSSMPTQDIQIFKGLGGEDCVVFNGPDEQFISGRAIGADGGIGGTYGVMPELFLKMDDLFGQGKIKEAQRVQFAVNEIISLMCGARGNLYAVMKRILQINEDLDIGSVRLPLLPLATEDEEICQRAGQMIRSAKEKYL